MLWVRFELPDLYFSFATLKPATVYKRVKFSFKVTGDLDDLEVYANKERLTVNNGKGGIDAEYSSGVLSMIFMLSGDNGAGYSIEYSCTVAGEKAEDSSKPSPVEGEIIRGGYREVIIRIKV